MGRRVYEKARLPLNITFGQVLQIYPLWDSQSPFG